MYRSSSLFLLSWRRCRRDHLWCLRSFRRVSPLSSSSLLYILWRAGDIAFRIWCMSSSWYLSCLSVSTARYPYHIKRILSALMTHSWSSITCLWCWYFRIRWCSRCASHQGRSWSARVSLLSWSYPIRRNHGVRRQVSWIASLFSSSTLHRNLWSSPLHQSWMFPCLARDRCRWLSHPIRGISSGYLSEWIRSY